MSEHRFRETENALGLHIDAQVHLIEDSSDEEMHRFQLRVVKVNEARNCEIAAGEEFGVCIRRDASGVARAMVGWDLSPWPQLEEQTDD